MVSQTAVDASMLRIFTKAQPAVDSRRKQRQKAGIGERLEVGEREKAVYAEGATAD